MSLRQEIGARVRELLAMAPSLREGGAPAGPPSPPTVRLELAGAVPGAVVRVVPGVLVLVAAALVGVGAAGWWAAVVAAGLVVARPGWPVAPAFLLLAGVWLYGGRDLLGAVAVADGGLLRLAALVATLHVLLRGAAVAQHVGWRTFVEVPVVLRALRSVALAQLPVQLLVLGAVWVRANLGGLLGGSEVVRLVGVAAVVAVVVLVLPRGRQVTRP